VYKELLSSRIVMVTAKSMALLFEGQTASIHSVRDMVIHGLCPQKNSPAAE
jgi:hypothetical protein